IDRDGHDEDKLGKFGTAPSETVPPTVTLTAPTAAATLTGVVTLSATAADNAGGSGVNLVQFLVDGSVVGQASRSPYSLQFDSAIATTPSHMFTAKAWDVAGNFTVSAPVAATVTGNVPMQRPDAPPGAPGGGGTGGSGGAGGGGGGQAGEQPGTNP